MGTYLYHAQPDLYEHDAVVLQARGDAVVLDRWALHPGGGGQVPDRAVLRFAGGSANVVDVLTEDGVHWLRLDAPAPLAPGDAVTVHVDRDWRHVLAQLHTATHILNALVYQRFAGALVTGAQINGDGTARMDFDLPQVDNDLLRALGDEINAVVRDGREVRAFYVSQEEARATHGLIRSMSVAPPPTDDGRVRIIDIAGLDRQACGGTHLANTAQSLPVAITKIENKGKQNRRVRIALVQP
ncbi:MAG: alanyl-tRNA editing protein [Pseudomonadota bacterium]